MAYSESWYLKWGFRQELPRLGKPGRPNWPRIRVRVQEGPKVQERPPPGTKRVRDLWARRLEPRSQVLYCGPG